MWYQLSRQAFMLAVCCHCAFASATELDQQAQKETSPLGQKLCLVSFSTAAAQPEKAAVYAGHNEFLHQLYAAQTLWVAAKADSEVAPKAGHEEFALLRCQSVAEAGALMQNNPAVKQGLFDINIQLWNPRLVGVRPIRREVQEVEPHKPFKVPGSQLEGPIQLEP